MRIYYSSFGIHCIEICELDQAQCCRLMEVFSAWLHFYVRTFTGGQMVIWTFSGSRAERASGRRLLLLWIALDPLASCLGVGSAEKRAGLSHFPRRMNGSHGGESGGSRGRSRVFVPLQGSAGRGCARRLYRRRVWRGGGGSHGECAAAPQQPGRRN